MSKQSGRSQWSEESRLTLLDKIQVWLTFMWPTVSVKNGFTIIFRLILIKTEDFSEQPIHFNLTVCLKMCHLRASTLLKSQKETTKIGSMLYSTVRTVKLFSSMSICKIWTDLPKVLRLSPFFQCFVSVSCTTLSPMETRAPKTRITT